MHIPPDLPGLQAGGGACSDSLYQVIPRAFQSFPNPGHDINAGICGACFDSLNVASVNIGVLGQFILRHFG